MRLLRISRYIGETMTISDRARKHYDAPWNIFKRRHHQLWNGQYAPTPARRENVQIWFAIAMSCVKTIYPDSDEYGPHLLKKITWDRRIAEADRYAATCFYKAENQTLANIERYLTAAQICHALRRQETQETGKTRMAFTLPPPDIESAAA